MSQYQDDSGRGRIGPFVIELDAPSPSPADAPPVPDMDGPVPRSALEAALLARAEGSASGATRLLLWAGGGLFTLILGLAAHDFVMSLMARYPLLGWAAAVLAGLVTLAMLWIAVREWAGLMRLGRVDDLRERAAAVQDLKGAQSLVADLQRLTASRPEMDWPRRRLAEQAAGLLDADALLHLAERELLSVADEAARREIEGAVRRVATATALIPMALVDVSVAMATNLRMIRRVAEIYGGRGGMLGSLRLLRKVMGHLLATGALAVGDDLISSVAGGGVMSKLSRRFGEGVINGALTARVGVAAMDVCRPMPFTVLARPRVGNLMTRALAGLFDSQSDRPDRA